DPKFAKAHSNLGNTLRATGNLEGAVACYRKALALDPKFAPAHVGLGNALYAQKDLKGAIAHLEQALDLDPEDALAHNSLGIALRAKGDLDGAIPHYRKAVTCYEKQAERFPDDPELRGKVGATLNNLAMMLRDRSELKEARRLLERAISHQQAALKVNS